MYAREKNDQELKIKQIVTKKERSWSGDGNAETVKGWQRDLNREKYRTFGGSLQTLRDNNEAIIIRSLILHDSGWHVRTDVSWWKVWDQLPRRPVALPDLSVLVNVRNY